MAHGYLTPTKVGDKDIFRTIKDLLDRFKEEGDKNGAPPEDGSDLKVVQKAGQTKVYKEPRTSEEKEQKKVNLLVTRMGGVLSNMMSRGGSKEQSVGSARKGGSFVNMGASTKPISDTNFFRSAVVEGVNPLTGEYYSPEERIAAFKKYRPNERTTQGVGVSGGGAGADIVAALSLNTAAVIRMENAVRQQTANDTKISNDQSNQKDTIFNKLLASQKEDRLEQGKDLSGNLRPRPVGRGGVGTGGLIGGDGPLSSLIRGADTFQTGAKLAANTTGAAKFGKAASATTGAITGGLAKLGFKAPRNIVKKLSSTAAKLTPQKALTAATKVLAGDNSSKLVKPVKKLAQSSAAKITTGMGDEGAERLLKAVAMTVDEEDALKFSLGVAEAGMNERLLLRALSTKGDKLVPKEEAMKTFANLVDDGVKPTVADDFLRRLYGPDQYKRLLGGATDPIRRLMQNTFSNKMFKAPAIEKITKTAAKTTAKTTGKAGLKSLAKKIPVIAGLAGIAFGIQRAMQGDLLGAGLEITSGLLGAISPFTGGLGTGLSYGIDGFLLARDLGMMPMKKGGILDSATPVVAGEAGDEAFAPLTGSQGKIAGSVFGEASAIALINFFKKQNPIEKLRYNSDHPMGTDQPNPFREGTPLYKNFEKMRQLNIIDPTLKISQNYMPATVNNGTPLANSSAEVASRDRKNNSVPTTVVIDSPVGSNNTGNSGMAMTTTPAGGSEDQGLNIYAAHLVMASA